MMPGWPLALAVAAGAYLLGSIPFGLLLTRIAGLGDIRAIGSGNIGATNVLRTGNKGLAALTLLLDGGKGALAVLIAWRFFPELAQLAGGAAVVGHLYPVWLRFKGGKGVATTLGVWLALIWPVGLSACLVWLAMAALFRLSSLAALVSIALAPLGAWLLGDDWSTALGLALAVLVAIKHRGNIERLIAGKEPKIGKKV